MINTKSIAKKLGAVSIGALMASVAFRCTVFGS